MAFHGLYNPKSNSPFPTQIHALTFIAITYITQQLHNMSGAFKHRVSVPDPAQRAGMNPQQLLSGGEVHVIIGPMFAGKTTALLRRVKYESNLGREVVMIKSSKDTRYAVDAVVTHDGTKFPCWALPDLSSFKQALGIEAYEKVDVIGIDEAQFFGDLYDFCCGAADTDGKTVIVAGLDGDYLRRSFGSVLDIIPIADTVTKLTARCELCGRKAFFTYRKTEETETELIGGCDMYMPVCREHYVNGNSAMEATKKVLESCKMQGELIAEAASSVAQ